MDRQPFELLVATLNPGKRKEIAGLLAGLPVQVMHLGDLNPMPDCEEDGSSFMENALKKAMHYHRLTGLPTLADDSGLEIDALGGLPGIRSARFAGAGATDADRVRKILGLMEAVPDGQRKARFVCAVAFCRDQQVAFQARESAEGMIIRNPIGDHGFGYDPIFLYPGLGRTFAQLQAEEKSRISHRGKALLRFRDFLFSEAPAAS
jgi:XTP/dITP diphosphohydrolase